MKFNLVFFEGRWFIKKLEIEYWIWKNVFFIFLGELIMKLFNLKIGGLSYETICE